MRTDGQTDMTTLIVAFCHFVSEPKIDIVPFRDTEGYSFLQV